MNQYKFDRYQAAKAIAKWDSQPDLFPLHEVVTKPKKGEQAKYNEIMKRKYQTNIFTKTQGEA